jgi:anaerobic magnesium-protoporphyrin IX monomethyl ester cyclase
MFSMKKTTLEVLSAIKSQCGNSSCLFVVGGPLPSWSPESFLGAFALVAVGEGEETIVDIANCVAGGVGFSGVKGLVYKDGNRVVHTLRRGFIQDLDSLAFPPRELFDNQAYKKYYLDRFGYTTSAMISSRGCPFSCDFCSRPVFGEKVRSRSVGNIIDE